MNRSSMSKQMMQEGGPVVPSKEEFAAMTPEQQAAQKKKAMMQNLNLTPKEKADKEAMEKEGIFSNMGGPAVSTVKKIAKMASGNKDKPKKKMNMGGMAKTGYSKGGNIPKYKAGKKVRGYGMARGGKACKMR